LGYEEHKGERSLFPLGVIIFRLDFEIQNDILGFNSELQFPKKACIYFEYLQYNHFEDSKYFWH
jgi:hypothetical protein